MPGKPPSRKPPRPPGSTVRRGPAESRQADLDRFIDTRPWRRLRLAYLTDHPLCESCKAHGLAVAAEHVHHREPRADRPDLALDRDNLQSLCRPCHSRATLAERDRRPPPAP